MRAPRAAAGLAFALASASCYGFNIITTRLASVAGVTGVTVVFYRVFVMLALVLLAVAILRPRLRIEPGERVTIAVLAGSTIALGLAYLSSVTYIPVTVAVVVFYTFPALIVLASPLVEGRRLDVKLLAVAALALTGVTLVVGPVFTGLDPRGLALAALASVAAAIQFFAAARCRHTGVLAKTVWVHLMVLPVTAVIGLFTGTLGGPDALLLAPLAVALTALGYVGGFLLQLVALARSSAVVAGIAYCLEPVVAALGSVALLGETLSVMQLAGGALVLAAIVTNVIVDHRRSSSPAFRLAKLGAPS